MAGVRISPIPNISCVRFAAVSIAGTGVLPTLKISWGAKPICPREANHVVTGNPL